MNNGALALSPRISIKNKSGAIPEADQASNDCHPATVTPMKLTKSFPAKAIARENVPASTMNFKGFSAKTRCMMKVSMVQTAALIPRMVKVFSPINVRISALMKLAPFNPLITRKYVIAVIAIPPKTAPYRRKPSFRLKVNNRRVMNWTKAPEENATRTLKKIPEMILVAVEKLMNSANSTSMPC